MINNIFYHGLISQDSLQEYLIQEKKSILLNSKEITKILKRKVQKEEEEQANIKLNPNMNQVTISQKCKLHQEQDIQLACLTQKSGDSLYCLICMLRDQMKHSFISIQQVIQNRDTLPIQNWPLGIEQNALDFLSSQSLYNKKESIKQKIQLFYKDLLSQIFKIIEDSQAAALQDLEKSKIGQNDLIQFYNQKFKRKELVNIFSNNSENLNEKYQLLLSGLDQTREADLAELYKKIQLFERVEKEISFDQPQQVKIITSQLLSKINFFSTNLIERSEEIDNSDQQSEQNDINNIGSVIIKNLSKFSDIKQTLITNVQELQQRCKENKSNIDEFLVNLQKKNEKLRLCQYEQLIEDIEQAKLQALSNQFNIKKEEEEIEEEQQNDYVDQVSQIISSYRNLNNEQQDMIRNYSNQGEKLSASQNYFKDTILLLNQNSQVQQINTIIVDQIKILNDAFQNNIQKQEKDLAENNKLVNQSFIDLKLSVDQLSDYFKVKNQIRLKQNSNNTSSILQFTKAEYLKSQDLEIGQDKDYNIFVTNNSKDILGQVYLNKQLSKNKCHIIRFRFNIPFIECDHIVIGLIQDSKNTTYIEVSGQYFYPKIGIDEQWNKVTVKKGNYIRLQQDKDTIKEIEMRVFLNKNIVQYSDYPDYNNIYQNKEQINLDEEYRIGIKFVYSLNKIVTITYYNEFDDFIPFC